MPDGSVAVLFEDVSGFGYGNNFRHAVESTLKLEMRQKFMPKYQFGLSQQQDPPRLPQKLPKKNRTKIGFTTH